MQENVSKRVAYLDVIRIVATFGIIAVHVFCIEYYFAVGTYNWYVSAVGDSLVRWSVPLFVMISGFLFLQPAKDVSYRILLKKYIPRLVLAYVFWSLAYSGIMSIREILHGREVTLDVLYPHFHLWYIPMLIGVYLLIPLLRRIVYEESLIRATLLLWIVYLTGCFCKFGQIHQIGILFNANSIVGYAGYFVLGYYVSCHDVSPKQARWIYSLGILGAIVCVCGNIILSRMRGTGDFMFLDYLGPHVVAMALALFVLVKRTVSGKEAHLMRFVEYVRKDLFGIYLTHGIWLLVFNTSLFRNMCNHLITLPLITVVIFFLSLYTTKLIRSIPLLRKTVE